MSFDKDKPAASTSLRASNPQLLANFAALETAANREHEFSTGGTAADQLHHKKGSARAYIQNSAPTVRVDGSAFNSHDLGSLWFDTDSSPVNEFYVLTATTPTWTAVSTEIIATLLAAARVFGDTLGVDGDFTVNSNFDVAAVSGNTDIAGTLDVTGILTTIAASVLGDGSTLAAATESGDGDRTIADKAYIEAQWTPNPASGESSKAGNNFTVKGGKTGIVQNESSVAIVFGTAFSTLLAITCTFEDAQALGRAVTISGVSVTGFTVHNTNTVAVTKIHWIAIGY